MSEPIQDVSRRDLLRITLTTFGVSVVNAEAAQHVHQAVAEVKKTGAYKPKFFNDHEYKTLVKLAEIYTGGLAWLDHQMNKTYSATFVTAAPEQQTAMLDLIAYRKNDSPEL